MVDSKLFIKYCKDFVVNYHNEHKVDLPGITEEDVYVVWLCKVLGNDKALLSTRLKDGMYYELTYNGDTDEVYLDAYIKEENVCIKL